MKTLALIFAICTSLFLQAQTASSTRNEVTATLENEDGIVTLVWHTRAEVNSRYFIVERSADGLHYSAVATCPASGHAVFPRSYSFSDITPGESVYRVTMVLMDGPALVSNCVKQTGLEDTPVPGLAKR